MSAMQCPGGHISFLAEFDLRSTVSCICQVELCMPLCVGIILHDLHSRIFAYLAAKKQNTLQCRTTAQRLMRPLLQVHITESRYMHQVHAELVMEDAAAGPGKLHTSSCMVNSM